MDNTYYNITMLNGNGIMARLCYKCGNMFETSRSGNVVTPCPSKKCNPPSRWGPLRTFASMGCNLLLGKCTKCGTWVEPEDYMLHAGGCR